MKIIDIWTGMSTDTKQFTSSDSEEKNYNNHAPKTIYEQKIKLTVSRFFLFFLQTKRKSYQKAKDWSNELVIETTVRPHIGRENQCKRIEYGVVRGGQWKFDDSISVSKKRKEKEIYQTMSTSRCRCCCWSF